MYTQSALPLVDVKGLAKELNFPDIGCLTLVPIDFQQQLPLYKGDDVLHCTFGTPSAPA